MRGETICTPDPWLSTPQTPDYLHPRHLTICTQDTWLSAPQTPDYLHQAGHQLYQAEINKIIPGLRSIQDLVKRITLLPPATGYTGHYYNSVIYGAIRYLYTTFILNYCYCFSIDLQKTKFYSTALLVTYPSRTNSMPGRIELENFILSLSSSPAQNLIYVRVWAKASSELPLPSETKMSSARISHLLSSPSRTWLCQLKICHQAEPSQATSDFLAQACLSFSKLPTLGVTYR